MKFLKPRTFVIFALAALSGAVLLHTSQSVQHAEEQLEILQSSIDREQEKLRLLKAEWASLNRPERLEKLAKEFLDLAPPQPETTMNGASEIPDIHKTDEENPLFEEEGTGATLQPVSMTPAAKQDPPAQKPEVQQNDKGFGDLMKELEKQQ